MRIRAGGARDEGAVAHGERLGDAVGRQLRRRRAAREQPQRSQTGWRAAAAQQLPQRRRTRLGVNAQRRGDGARRGVVAKARLEAAASAKQARQEAKIGAKRGDSAATTHKVYGKLITRPRGGLTQAERPLSGA